MNKKITIVGSGQISVAPDFIVVHLTVSAENMDYNLSHENHVNKVDSLVSALNNIGVDSNDIKTSSYNIDSIYNDKRDKNGDYKRVFAGYRFKQDFNIEFDYDTEKLTNIINTIMHIDSDPNMRIRFTIKDNTAVKNQLLAKATADAIAKADILCESLGVKKGEIISVNYSFGDMEFESETNYSRNNIKYMCESAPSHFVADDIDVSDSVTFTWAINE